MEIKQGTIFSRLAGSESHRLRRLHVGELGRVLIEQGLELKRGSISRVRPLKLHPRPLQERRAVDLRRNIEGRTKNEKRGHLFEHEKTTARTYQSENVTKRIRWVSYSCQAEEVDQGAANKTKEGESLHAGRDKMLLLLLLLSPH